MAKSYSNKPIVILKTSFTVSFVCAAGLGVFYSLNNNQSWNEFMYVTYVFFVNNLLMPVSIAAIVYFYRSKDKKRRMGLMGKLKDVVVLSAVSLVLLFVWNAMDFLLHFHTESLSNEHFREGMLLGSLLAFPVSLLVILIYDFIDAEN